MNNESEKILISANVEKITDNEIKKLAKNLVKEYLEIQEK
jgi:hypothetical protein